jgi:hypothetical protein
MPELGCEQMLVGWGAHEVEAEAAVVEVLVAAQG